MNFIKKITLAAMLTLVFLGTSFASAVFIESDALQKKIENKDLVIIDMSDEDQYKRFHLPNAMFLSYGEMNERDKQGVSNSIGVDKMIQLLSEKGLTQNDDVVIYDDMAGLHAGRLYWELERLGHKKIALLNGGLVGWVLKHHKVSNDVISRPKTTYTPSKVSTDTLVSLADVVAASKDANALIIDVRSEGEYTGSAKKARSGHVPGALWFPWNKAVNLDKGFDQKDSAEINAELKSMGVTDKDANVIVYCQSGHRASQTYITLKSLGYNNVRLYDGSMSEYTSDKTAPLVKGSNSR